MVSMSEIAKDLLNYNKLTICFLLTHPSPALSSLRKARAKALESVTYVERLLTAGFVIVGSCSTVDGKRSVVTLLNRRLLRDTIQVEWSNLRWAGAR
jgi:hypothetical protein